MDVPVPSSLTQQIAQRAAQYAREYSETKQWKDATTDSLLPVFDEGIAGIKTSRTYLMFVEKGTEPFLMTSLEGKTIPIKGPNGVHFVKVKGVGQPGFVTLPGGVRIWRQQKWRHPGIKPQHFMQKSIERALQDFLPELQKLGSDVLNVGS